MANDDLWSKIGHIVLDMLRDDAIKTPHPSRLGPGHPRFAEVMRRHDDAVAAGLPSYRDPHSGFAVFTAALLAERNACCNSGCRHCPYIGATGPGS